MPNTSPRIALFSAHDVNMILCGLRLLEDIVLVSARSDMPPSGDDLLANELATGVTLADVDQLMRQLARNVGGIGTCGPCSRDDHADCMADWIDGVDLVHCTCAAGPCGYGQT